MARNLPVSTVLPLCMVFQLAALALPAFGQASSGRLSGVTQDSASGKPVVEVQIIAHNVDKGMDRATTSGTDGAFTMVNLEPGRYHVAASKEGFLKATANVEVTEAGTYRVDFSLAATHVDLAASGASLTIVLQPWRL